MAFADTSLDLRSAVPVLREGSAVIASEGIAEVDVRDLHLRALAGAYYVSATQEKLTVVAVTAPVLASQGGRRVLIPIGKQWSSGSDSLSTSDAGMEYWLRQRALHNPPRRFLLEQMQSVNVLPPHEPASMSRLDASTDMLRPPDALLLESARKRTEAQLAIAALANLKSAAERGDAQEVERIFLDEQVAQALLTPDSMRVIAILAARSPHDSDVTRALLSWLVLDSDLWLIASIHPQFAALAWTFAVPALTVEERLLSWFALPVADLSPRGMNGVVVSRWKQQLGEYVDRDDARTEVLSAVIVHSAPVIEEMNEKRYPLRARSYADALHDVAADRGSLLSGEANDALARLSQLQSLVSGPVDVAAYADLPEVAVAETEMPESEVTVEARPVEQEEAKVEAPLPDSGLAPAEVESRAREILREAGALFTVDTVLVVRDSRIVLVDRIVFSGPQRDRVITFELDVVAGRVAKVTENGKEYPYALWIEDFVRWART